MIKPIELGCRSSSFKHIGLQHHCRFTALLFRTQTTHHLLLDETQRNVHIEAIYRDQTQMNYIDEGIFPILSHHQALAEVEVPESIGNIHYGLTSTRIPIRPARGPDHSKCVSLQPQSYIDLILANEEFKQTFTAAKAQQQAMHEIAKMGAM
jgi:hypothetical protein